MPKRAQALVIAFFPAFVPPSSGGEMRLGSLYRELSRHYDIMLLTSTHFGARIERITHGEGFVELRFPKDEHWRKAYATLKRAGMSGDLAGLAFALAVADPDCPLRREARRLARDVDVVIHDFPFSEPIFDDGCPAPEIYNSHNVEASLFSSIISGAGAESGFLKLLRLEGNLVARARRVYAASTTDCEIFRLLYGANPGQLAICPNGIDEREYEPIDELRWSEPEAADRRPKLLFLGSRHPPNVDAAQFLLTVAEGLPEFDFVIAGGVCRALASDAAPLNVTLIGAFNPERKLALLADADLFINPVVLGSGTSLKSLEAMAAALPLVATPEGARGLDIIPGTHAAITTRESMASTIRALIADAPRRQAMATAGRDLVNARYCWRGIADELAAALHVKPNSEPAKPLVLAFNDYTIGGLRSGGAARIRGLLSHLGRDVALVTFGDAFTATLLAPGFLVVTIKKAKNQRTFEAAVSAGRALSADDAVAALFAGSNRVLGDVAARLAARASVVVFEHPYMAPVLDTIQTQRPDLPIIYSAHNVEAEYKREMWRDEPLCDAITRLVEKLENELLARADLVVACTDADAHRFYGGGAEVVVAPNGCDLPDLRAPKRARGSRYPRVGFLGSGHPPNVEAAVYIIRVLAPQFPEVGFEFIGTVCDAFAERPANVVIHGRVTEVVKSELLRDWDLALNPLASGGGSSLKLPDYFAHGLPTLSTPEGARGFPVAEQGLGRVVQLADFPAAFTMLLRNRAELKAFGQRARRFAVDELAWPRASAAYRERLTALAVPPLASTRRMLVVTYRYTEPALGGAEEYLIAVLERLRPRFQRIDLAAIDVEEIGNRMHFGCRVTPGPGAVGRISELFDATRYFHAEEPDDATLMAHSRQIARDWAREELALMAPLAGRLALTQGLYLLAGFFPPEVDDGLKQRWTAPAFILLAPSASRVLVLKGFAPRPTTLRLAFTQGEPGLASRQLGRAEAEISGAFELHFGLPGGVSEGLLWISGAVDQFTAPDDVRPLGVLLEMASALCEPLAPRQDKRSDPGPLVPITANLGMLLDEIWSRAQLEEWVDSLVHVARHRSPETDAAFAAARGPHSPAMQSWLASHAANYDVVLVQGIPFDVIPRTVETLSRLPLRPRVVTLPHFHGDDRFYHWRNYYRAFDQADSTLLFSDFLADRIASREKVAIVPGGGVRLDEAADQDAPRRFRALRRSAKPYFLILGRKTSSKNYQRVIDAHQVLRRGRPDVDLVLIGPDDDERSVVGAGVTYLGRQPREIVRGALSGCLALINMSASESFGLVLCEAWLFHRPVIANADCYAFRALARDGEDSLLVGSDAALVAAMERLAGDPDERERMGRAGFEQTAALYSWTRVANEIAESLEGPASA